MWISSLVLLLVLVSAGLHATWNLLVKRSEDTLIASWLTVLTPPLLLWPLLFFTGLPPSQAWPMLVGSGLVQAAYTVALARAYEYGDLSVIYPVARGLAPLLVAAGAPLFLGERISAVAALAILLVAGGITWLGASTRKSPGRSSGLGWAAVTALLIATYSIVDKAGVMRSNPLAYVVTLFGFDAAYVTPYVLLHRGRRRIRKVWRDGRASLVSSGLLSLAAYLLVLIAMRLTQVSYVATLRESSTIFGAVLGWRVLGDPFGGQRVSASALVALGLILLALAMHGQGK
jgi:drug/metabolite transporter (DMT)-like permease